MELPEGWTMKHQHRTVGHEDAASAFKDGMQWSLLDPDGERPPQADWPTPYRETAVLYARALDARRKAAAAGEVSPPWAPPPTGDGLTGVERPPLVEPERWDGPIEQRPGLYRRTTN